MAKEDELERTDVAIAVELCHVTIIESIVVAVGITGDLEWLFGLAATGARNEVVPELDNADAWLRLITLGSFVGLGTICRWPSTIVGDACRRRVAA